MRGFESLVAEKKEDSEIYIKLPSLEAPEGGTSTFFNVQKEEEYVNGNITSL